MTCSILLLRKALLYRNFNFQSLKFGSEERIALRKWIVFKSLRLPLRFSILMGFRVQESEQSWMTIEDDSKPSKQSHESEKKSSRNKRWKKKRKKKQKDSLCRECETYHSPADGCGENKRRKSEFLSSDSRLSEAKAQAEQVRASIFDSRQYQWEMEQLRILKWKNVYWSSQKFHAVSHYMP